MDVIRVKLAQSVNSICNSAENFGQCCPDSGTWGGQTKPMVGPADLLTARTYPVVMRSGEIEGIVNFRVYATNKLCPKGMCSVPRASRLPETGVP